MQEGVVTISVERRGRVGFELRETCLGTHLGVFTALSSVSSPVPAVCQVAITCLKKEKTGAAKVCEMSDLILSTIMIQTQMFKLWRKVRVLSVLGAVRIP